MSHTPSPQYLELISSKSKEEVLHVFLEHLKAKYPLPEDVKLTVEFTDAKLDNGRSLGINDQSPVHRTSKITIYQMSKSEIISLISVLAHEYKHALQAFIEYPDKYFKRRTRDFKETIEMWACAFGSIESRKFMFGWP